MGHPVMLYRKNHDGSIENKIFDGDDLPKAGWGDSPANAPGRRGRKPKPKPEEGGQDAPES